MPAEWHRQRCVQITWPDAETDWRPYLEEITAVMVSVASAVTADEDLLVTARDAERALETLEKSLSPEQMRRVTVAECPVNDTWCRDYGGITLLDRDSASKLLLDFRFNGWGGKFPAGSDNLVTSRLGAAGYLEGTLEDNNDFVLEGGSIESDGRGTVFTTACCLTAPGRNAGMDKPALERELLRRLRARRVVWLTGCALPGDDTDGHIDTLVRVCPEDTLLYVRCADETDPAREGLALMEAELMSLRTLSGRPYNLRPLPLPRPVCYEGERLPATYANFLVTNSSVLVPVYNRPETDDEACRVIAGAFPGRKIVRINSGVIVRQHGSVHCLTMQYPE